MVKCFCIQKKRLAMKSPMEIAKYLPGYWKILHHNINNPLVVTNAVDYSFKNKNRIEAICKEMTRNPVCATCPVSSICNGDCYKLPWEEDICAAPKSLMKYIKENKDFSNLEKLILN